MHQRTEKTNKKTKTGSRSTWISKDLSLTFFLLRKKSHTFSPETRKKFSPRNKDK